MKPMFPIKQRGKAINILSQRRVINILIETKLNTPPLGDILINLNGYNIEHLVPERGNPEIGIGTENLSKGPFGFGPFPIKRIKR